MYDNAIRFGMVVLYPATVLILLNICICLFLLVLGQSCFLQIGDCLFLFIFYVFISFLHSIGWELWFTFFMVVKYT